MCYHNWSFNLINLSYNKIGTDLNDSNTIKNGGIGLILTELVQP